MENATGKLRKEICSARDCGEKVECSTGEKLFHKFKTINKYEILKNNEMLLKQLPLMDFTVADLANEHISISQMLFYNREDADYLPASLSIYETNILMIIYDNDLRPLNGNIINIANNTSPIEKPYVLENGYIRALINDDRIVIAYEDYRQICNFANIHNLKMDQIEDPECCSIKSKKTLPKEPWIVPNQRDISIYEFALFKIKIYSNDHNDFIFTNLYLNKNTKENTTDFLTETFDNIGQYQGDSWGTYMTIDLSCKVTKKLDDGMLMVLLNEAIELILNQEEYNLLFDYIASKASR